MRPCSSRRIAGMASGLALVVLSTAQPSRAQSSCVDYSVGLQILGSGGPFLNPERASSSYLVWVDGRARVLIDVGGGAFLRFGQAGAGFEDLSLVAISHLHPDHVSDLPALLWTTNNFRDAPLPLSGPSGDDTFPGLSSFVSRLLSSQNGAFPILSWTLGDIGEQLRRGRRTGYPLQIIEVDTKAREPQTVIGTKDVTVTAIGVPHNAPALGYRVQVGEATVVFSSDQNGTDPAFARFAEAADVLVMHFMLSPRAVPGEPNDRPHATPDVVGRTARDARVGKLVLSHFGYGEKGRPNFGTFSLDAMDESVAEVRKFYDGEIVQATDLQCIRLR